MQTKIKFKIQHVQTNYERENIQEEGICNFNTLKKKIIEKMCRHEDGCAYTNKSEMQIRVAVNGHPY